MTAPGTRAGGAVLALLAFAQLIITLDVTIVYVALPDIGSELHFSEGQLQWVISAYAVAFGGFLLLGGRAADLLGRRRMFLLGLALYAVSSALGGLTHDAGLLVAARAVQGIGGALLFPATLSLVTTLFEEGPRRNRALAVWGGAGAAGLATGSLLGGVLTDLAGWQAVFHVNVPLAGGAALLALRLLPPDRTAARWSGIDLPGAAVSTAGLTSVVLALAEGPEQGWTSPRVLVCLATGLVLLGLFGAQQARSRRPLMPVGLFRNRALRGALVVVFLFQATFGVQYYVLTVYLQDLRGYSPMAAGLAFLLPAVLVIAGTQWGERLSGRLGTRGTLVLGMGLGCAGMLLLALALPSATSYAALVPGIALTSLGNGVTWTAIWVAASGVDAQDQGIASAMASTMQQIGGAVGLAVLVAVANAGVAHATGDVLLDERIAGLRTAVSVTAALTACGAVFSAFAFRGKSESGSAVPKKHAGAGEKGESGSEKHAGADERGAGAGGKERERGVGGRETGVGEGREPAPQSARVDRVDAT